MKESKVGRIKNLKVNIETNELELTIAIENLKFQREILRNLSLAGNLAVEGEDLIFIPKDQHAKI